MPSHCRSTVIFALCFLVFAANPVSGKEIEDRKWIEVQTPNFRIRSAMSEKDSIKLARHLEMFRVAISVITNIRRIDSPIPTEIYAMRGSSDFKSLGIDHDVGGFFYSSLRDNMIVIRDVNRMQETSIIMHEYVHFLVRNQGSLNYPMWFDEGFAEYLSAGRSDAGNFEIGRVPEHRRDSLAYLRWIPLRNILSPENYGEWSRQRKSMYYAEAWALVHYLQNRTDRDVPFGQEMARYIELVESGKDELDAFEEAFAITVVNLDDRVQRYIEGRRLPGFRLKTDPLLPDFQPTVRTLSRAQISLGLGKLALRMHKLDMAEHWYTIATTNEATRPQAEAGLGDVLKFGGKFEAAQPHFELAVALAPEDPYCQLDIAEFWHTRAEDPDETGNRAKYLERAREHYLKAWKLDDSMPETYAMYGETFVMEDRQYDLAIEMLEQAEYLLPSDLSVRAVLAQAYMGAGRRDDADRTARSVLAWSHGESGVAKTAKEILAKLASESE